MSTPTDSESRRRRAVEQALANQRLSGASPPAGYVALLDQYVRGELTMEQLQQLPPSLGMDFDASSE
jgi:hypothetical protein